jgi:hypothetical protein
MTDNSPSKGGSINSKGGRRPRGRLSRRADCCEPVHTTASCARPRNTFSNMVTPQQMSLRRIPMTWFCEMANSVIGDKGELLEYRHLIANHATQATCSTCTETRSDNLPRGCQVATLAPTPSCSSRRTRSPRTEPRT